MACWQPGHNRSNFLLEGFASAVLGLPLGVGQGNNRNLPAARCAVQWWATTTPTIILQMVTGQRAIDEIIMHFEPGIVVQGVVQSGVATSLRLI